MLHPGENKKICRCKRKPLEKCCCKKPTDPIVFPPPSLPSVSPLSLSVSVTLCLCCCFRVFRRGSRPLPHAPMTGFFPLLIGSLGVLVPPVRASVPSLVPRYVRCLLHCSVRPFLSVSSYLRRETWINTECFVEREKVRENEKPRLVENRERERERKKERTRERERERDTERER